MAPSCYSIKRRQPSCEMAGLCCHVSRELSETPSHTDSHRSCEVFKLGLPSSPFVDYCVLVVVYQMKERGCGEAKDSNCAERGRRAGRGGGGRRSRENAETTPFIYYQALRPCYDKWRRCEDPITTGNNDFYDPHATLLTTLRLEVTTN